MAKEMMIIFVYDTQMVQKEEDDPFSAILYFHPSWVSDQQKTALCGQLMGTAHCIKNIFSSPQIISLQSGKFFIKEYGRYFMAVGTDRNIADWLLEHRAKTMSSIVSFFYSDIEIMSKIFPDNSKLSAKLYLLFETYLKYLFVGGNIFSYTPSLKLPKSSSNVFLEAIQILQCCQEINYVLGGTILYHNKVLATQLSTTLTKIIVLTDPYRITCPAETPSINFDVPIGVQLLQVYIPYKEYSKLNEEAIRSRTIFQFLGNKSIRKIQCKTPAKEPVISAMKRDQSIIFTAVPEEDTEHSSITIAPPDKPFIIQNRPNEIQNRPKFLNLKSKVTDINIEPKPTQTKSNLPTPSVCSTPMTELNKMILSKPLSICTTNHQEDKDDNINQTTSVSISPKSSNESPKKTIKDFKPIPGLKITKNLFDMKKYSSVFDVREKLKSIDSSITMKYYKIDLRENVDEKMSKNHVQNGRRLNTITDPNYPIFRSDGTVVSHNFYESYIRKEIQLISTEMKDENDKNHKNKNHFDNFDYCATDLIKKITAKPPNIVNTVSNKDRRKSLNLPLKSLSIDSGGDQMNINTPMRRHSSGVQLTPLMSKLSSFDDRSSGFGSRDITPSEYRIFTPTQANFPFPFKKKIKPPIEPSDSTMQKCVLFICGQQDMVMALLLQEDSATSLEPITKLWDICTENLGKLEKQVHHCLETYPGNNMPSDGEQYSYLHLDPEWDTVDRGGPWGSSELAELTHFHRDFKEDSSLTEILVRSGHGVIYGNKCGTSEVFYHQPVVNNCGIPTPADPMGTLPLKARRRLERDHSIILL